MSSIQLPAFYARKNLARALESVLTYDQWDDWVPDPIYYKDVARRASDFVTELAGKTDLSLDGSYRLPIYSEKIFKFDTVAIPLNSRVALNGLIASQGDAIKTVLQADRLSGFEYLPPSVVAVPGWTGDLFGSVYGRTAGANVPAPTEPFNVFAPFTRTRNPPLFTAGGEGLAEALAGAGVWLSSKQSSVRSVIWADVQGFFPQINRDVLWKVLGRAGVEAGFTDCLEAACRQLGGQGLRPIDDAWTFLSSFYLTPVDAALSKKANISWQRCGDEYLILAGDASSRNEALSLLSAELGKLGLKLNPSKTATLEVSSSDGPQERAMLFDGFRLRVEIEASSVEWAVTTSESWPGMLRAVLTPDASSARNNAVMLLLRSIHVAREADVFELCKGSEPASVRGKRYLATIRSLDWLPKQASASLQQAIADKHWWTCYWLLLLISDLGDRAAPALQLVSKMADNPALDATLRAHATLALAKVGNEGDVRTLLRDARPTGSTLGDRALLVAAFFAEKRWRRNSFDAWRAQGDAPLFEYLALRLKGREG